VGRGLVRNSCGGMGERFGEEFVSRTLCTRDPIPLKGAWHLVAYLAAMLAGVFVGVFCGDKWEMSRILGIE